MSSWHALCETISALTKRSEAIDASIGLAFAMLANGHVDARMKRARVTVARFNASLSVNTKTPTAFLTPAATGSRVTSP
ncbi:hypothetical protein [Propionivibrio soli]|uniref:hypothetical protein n=1 Tax=Propionivibrio soli TaxID=2976531 RepID=UPI0021E7766B|nr:hypothetical protein [Propionivibrio soli]